MTKEVDIILDNWSSVNGSLINQFSTVNNIICSHKVVYSCIRIRFLRKKNNKELTYGYLYVQLSQREITVKY